MSESFDLLYTNLKREIEANRITRSEGWILTRKEHEDYSLRNVFASLTRSGDGKLGFEQDVSQSNRCLGSDKVTGFFVPWEVGFTRGESERMMRDGMSSSVFGSGGATVQTDVASTIIPLLRNRTVALRLGATVIDRLKGNFSLPRETAPSQPGWVSETGQAPQGDLTFDQVTMAPARLSVTLTYSRQLLLQSNAAIEAFLRKDMMAQIGVVLDQAILNGQGGNSQPCGILNTPGVAQEIFGGTPTWAQLTNFEQVLAAANADQTGRFLGQCHPQSGTGGSRLLRPGSGLRALFPYFCGIKETITTAAMTALSTIIVRPVLIIFQMGKFCSVIGKA
jgi:hypothetical protein